MGTHDRHQISFRIVVGLAIIFIVASVSLFLTANQTRAAQHLTQYGKPIDAIIIEITSSGDYVYEYIVDNVVYQTKQSVEREHAAYALRMGNTVTLLYDPDNPVHADLLEKRSRESVAHLLLTYMMSFGSCLLAFTAFIILGRWEASQEPSQRRTPYDQATL